MKIGPLGTKIICLKMLVKTK